MQPWFWRLMVDFAKEHSYGIVPLRKKGEEWEVLLVYSSKSRYWGLPKGHADAGETPEEAAIRELQEETNLTVVRFLSDSVIEEHYEYSRQGDRIPKTVWFFVAEVEGELRLQTQEISESRWVSLKEAEDLLTYETDRSICRTTAGLI